MISRNLGDGGSLWGDMWPPEMSIAVVDDDPGILSLLWVREAFGISAGSHAPPPLVEAPERLGSADLECGTSWQDAWRVHIEFVSQRSDPLALQRLQLTTDMGTEPEQAARSLLGPLWDDRLNALRDDDAFGEWQKQLILRASEINGTPLPTTPERMTQVSLVPAWEAGLRRIITIPCLGEYSRILGPTALLVTDQTRADPKTYSEAHEQFRELYGKPGPGWTGHR